MRLAALLLGLALVVAGCSEDEPEPSPAPTSPAPSTSSVAASPSPTPTVDPDSPEAFISQWFEAADDAQRTGHTETFRSMSVQCQPCDAVADRIEKIYAKGGQINFEGSTVSDIRPHQGTADFRRFRFRVVTGPTEYRERAGGPLKSLPGDDLTYDMTLLKVEGEWRVTLYAVVDK